MLFSDRGLVAPYFKGKTVALVGSGPGSLENPQGLIDSHDTVVRVNNYKLSGATGARTDVFYSFFGNSIRKSAEDLKRDGVRLCICKCPNAQFLDSDWHRRRGKLAGVDFRYIYRCRAGWWFCPTYVPTAQEFLRHFELLNKHVPTTGFAALLEVLSYEPRHVYVTGFDFFSSGVHNVNEAWKSGDPSDPIGHDPAAEFAWFRQNYKRLPVRPDAALLRVLEGGWRMPEHVKPKIMSKRDRRIADFIERRRRAREAWKKKRSSITGAASTRDS